MRGRMFRGAAGGFALCAAALLHFGCATAYYTASEFLGSSKRDLLADRVDLAAQAQSDASAQLQKTFDALSALAGYAGEEIPAVQRRVAAEQRSAESRMQSVRDRIVAMDKVSNALFEEWEFENVQITDPDLRRRSRAEMNALRERVTRVRSALNVTSERGDRLLTAMRDHVLFIKHDPSPAALTTLQENLPALRESLAKLKTKTNALQAETRDYLKKP